MQKQSWILKNKHITREFSISNADFPDFRAASGTLLYEHEFKVNATKKHLRVDDCFLSFTDASTGIRIVRSNHSMYVEIYMSY